MLEADTVRLSARGFDCPAPYPPNRRPPEFLTRGVFRFKAWGIGGTPIESNRVLIRTMRGWIINLHSTDPAQTREEERDQEPAIYLPGSGEPVFEVWFWHAQLARWFVMSKRADPLMQAKGVVYFDPDEVADSLRERIRSLGGVA